MWLLNLAVLILVLTVLSALSKHVKYLCKTVVYSFVFLILAVMHMIYCPFFPKNRDNTYTLAPFFYYLSRLDFVGFVFTSKNFI